MRARDFDYTGKENLDVMTVADNYNKFLVQEILSVYPRKTRKNARVLDFGSGIGTYADMLKQQGRLVECLEPDGEYQKLLKNKGYKVESRSTKLDDEAYDLVYALNVLEHIEDDLAEMKTLFNKVKKGGHVVIYVPAFQVLYSSMDRNVGHYRRYRRRELESVMKNAGFKIVRSGYRDPLGFFAALTLRVAGDKSGELSERSVRFYDRLVFPVSHKISRITSPLFGKNVLVIAKRI